MHAVIMAGGRGVRLRPFTTALPKPLVPIGEGEVILEVILDQLSQAGFTSVTISINHLGHLIRAFAGDGRRWGLRIQYAEEPAPLSTVGPLFLLKDVLPEHFLVMNGDVLTSLDFAHLLDEHAVSGAPLTVATASCVSKVDFGVLDVMDGRIRGFREKPEMRHQVSMGVYAMSRSTIERYPAGLSYGFDSLILDLLERGQYPASYAFDGYWLDIGRPDDYDWVNSHFAEIRPSLVQTDFGPPVGKRIDFPTQVSLRDEVPA